MTIVTTATKMTSNDDKKHSVSNWFSSLRRQPKPKKVTNKNHLQKSCLDLTSIATNSTSLPASPKLRNGGSHYDANHLLTSKSSTVAKQLPTSATGITPNINGKLNSSTNNANNGSEATNIKFADSGESGQNSPSLSSHSGKTVTTTITRKITKITVIKNKEQNFRRAGLIFDDNGKLISESIAYQNFTKNFRSNLIDNVGIGLGSGSIKTSDIINACDNNQIIDDIASSASAPSTTDGAAIQCNAKIDVVNCGDGVQECGEKSSCSISDRLITSNNLDDEIEFIDSSSSMSDICSISNSAVDDIYFNTLPKLPKSYASIKQQKIEQQLGGKISNQPKVDTH